MSVVHNVTDKLPAPLTASTSRIADDGTTVNIGTERYWLYTAIDVEMKLLLNVMIAPHRETDSTAEKHDFFH